VISASWSLLQLSLAAINTPFPLFLPSVWTAAGRQARALPEFSDFLRRSGLAEYWDASGPPDLCAKNESGDYLCD
jgi:hypothetical protein